MSKNSIQGTKNKVGNKISDAKKSIESTKKEIQDAIGLIKTFCELPSRGINFSIRWIDAIDAVRMLIEILAGLIGRKLSELKVDLSKFLVTKVFSLSKQLTFDLCEILRIKLTGYVDKLNLHIMNDGSGNFIGCMCR